ncbi:MAG TPA: ABC transporter permease, partial [Steroidobacteraceae bacterium]|nr:ABC transporter permease [Steroidobacteraceae bacterium]
MFHPLPLYVGLRYVRARSHKFFVSFITWASLVGVGVGVAALIVILSVMNGFESELRDRLLSLSAQVRVIAAAGSAAPAGSVDWQDAARRARAVAEVLDVAPYAELQALAMREPEMLPVVLRGIDPTLSATVTEIGHAVTQGHLKDLVPGSGRVIVGEVIAERLGLAVGDPLTLLVPTMSEDGIPQGKLRAFTVAGVFEVGLQDHDGTLVFAPLADVRALAPAGASGQGLRIRVADVLAAPAVAERLRRALGAGYEVRDWTQDN